MTWVLPRNVLTDHADSGGPELASLLRQIRLRPGRHDPGPRARKGGANCITFARSGFKRVDGIENFAGAMPRGEAQSGAIVSDVHVIEL